MIKVDSVLEYLDSQSEPKTFEEIFSSVSDKLADIHDREENALKAELWNALIGSIEIVRIEENKFDLAKKYSLDELRRIEKLNIGTEDIETEEIEEDLEDELEDEIVLEEIEKDEEE